MRLGRYTVSCTDSQVGTFLVGFQDKELFGYHIPAGNKTAIEYFM